MQNEPLRVDESTDVAAFQQELQRVVPQLKITIRPNLKVNLNTSYLLNLPIIVVLLFVF